MGEPAGIGPELSLDAWLRLRESGPAFVHFADPDFVAATARSLGRDVPIVSIGTVAEGTVRLQTILPIITVKSHAID